MAGLRGRATLTGQSLRGIRLKNQSKRLSSEVGRLHRRTLAVGRRIGQTGKPASLGGHGGGGINKGSKVSMARVTQAGESLRGIRLIKNQSKRLSPAVARLQQRTSPVRHNLRRLNKVKPQPYKHQPTLQLNGPRMKMKGSNTVRRQTFGQRQNHVHQQAMRGNSAAHGLKPLFKKHAWRAKAKSIRSRISFNKHANPTGSGK